MADTARSPQLSVEAVDAPNQPYRYTQSQFAALLLAVVGGTIVFSRIARYAGSWSWISHLTAEVTECLIWCVLAIPLIYVARRTRMSPSMRRWLTALILFQTGDVVLDLTHELSLFNPVPFAGGEYMVYDGHNGSLNSIAIFACGIGSACCLMFVWYFGMVEIDTVRNSLARKTERLQVEIRERQRAEARVQQLNLDIQHSSRLNTMGEMAAGVAHELHQPLAAIANFANGGKIRLTNGTLTPEETGKAFDQIADGALRAGSIVGRIKSFLQKKARTVVLSDANDVVRDAVQLAQQELKERKIGIQLDFADDLPPVPIDPVEVAQVVLNLVLNGIDAIAAADKTLRSITIQTRRNGEDAVQISVRDSGPGILPDADSKIYDQFFTTKQQGLGMGLAICRAIVERYAGRLWHESEPGTGSIFHFTLPTAQNEPVSQRLAKEQVA